MRLLPAALLALIVCVAPFSGLERASAQQAKGSRNLAARCAKPEFAKANPRSCARYVDQKPAAEPAKQPEQPSRPDFTAEDQAVAVIPGIPDARFWADSEKDFLAVLPATPGPWLALSTGGGDGAFGAGVLRRHGGQHGLADGTVRVHRPIARPGAQARLHRIQRGRHFRRHQDTR